MEVERVRQQRADSQQAVGRLEGGPKLLLTAPGFPMIRPGDLVEFDARLKAPADFSEFDYRAYLAKDGIHLVSYARQIEVVGHRQTFGSLMYDTRRHLSEAVAAGMTEPVGSFIQGILLGERTNLPPWLTEDFRRTGTAHVLALSGYNISIILGAVVMLLGRRPLMIGVAVGTVIGFVFIVGATAPVVRAALMGCLLILSQALGRPALATRLCLVTAAVTLVFSPWALRYDIGWQLSFLATLGILVTAPWFVERMPRLPRLVRDPAAVTVAASVFTAPVIILSFGTSSLISPLANLVVVPLIPWLMLGGAVTAVSQVILPPLTPVIAIPTDWLGRFCLEAIHLMATVPLAQLTLPSPWLKPAALLAAAVAGLTFIRAQRADVR